MSQPLIDAAGTAHQAATGPVRIVSLVPSITECLCDMDLQSQLVGRTGFCIHPRATLRRIPKVGGTKDVDLEKIRALAPTHIILNMDENRKETAQALAEFVPSIVVTHPRSPEDNLSLYALLGELFDRKPQAENLASRLHAALTEIRGATTRKPRSVLYLIWRRPWMTISPNTYISRMLSLVNWHTEPRVSHSRYPEIKLNNFCGQVDLALLSSEPYPFRQKHLSKVQKSLGPKTSVQLISGDMVSWYGSRAIDGIKYLQDFAQKQALT